MTAGKADHTKGYGNPKRKLWVTTHLSEILKYTTKYGTFFPDSSLIVSEKSVITPNALFGFQQPLQRSAFPTKS